MNYNKYTLKSQEALQKAQQICHELEHQQIENSHVLKGILEIDQNVLPYILKKAGIDFQHFNQKLRIEPNFDIFTIMLTGKTLVCFIGEI